MSRGWKVPPAPSCAAPAPTPTLLYQTSDPLQFIGHFAIDAEFVYVTTGDGVTRVSKCDGSAVTLAAPPPDMSGQAGSVAVSGETVAWIVLIGIGGAVLATSTQPGGVASVLASTGAPLADALAVDADRAYFADAPEADDLGLRVALDEQRGGIAGAAAEIDDAARARKWHLRQKIARRPRTLILEFQILPRAPVIHRCFPSSQFPTIKSAR